MRERGPRRALVAVGGLVASGKSTLARALSQRLDAFHIQTDRIRDQLAARRGYGPRDVRAFGPEVEDRIYPEAMRRAEAVPVRDERIVLDGCFAREAQRASARAVARRRGLPFLFVECRADESVVASRLDARDAAGGPGGWRALQRELAERWEPVRDLDRTEYVRVHTDGAVEEAVEAVLAHLPQAGAERLRDPGTGRLRPAAVTFDCWNTLLVEEDWNLAHALRVAELRNAAREAGLEVGEEAACRAFDAAWDRHMRLWREGTASGAREVAHWGLANLGLSDPHPALEHLVHHFEEASHTSRVEALAGARELLEALSSAGVRCALVCDTGLTPGRVVRRHLERLGLLEGLAAQSFSDETGVPKPDPRAFEAALDALGVAPERALHVGDLRRTDVAGARRLGMTTVRIRARHDDRSELPEADFVVDSHAELRGLLELDA